MSQGDRVAGALGLSRRPVGIQFRSDAPTGVEANTRPAPGGCSFWEWGSGGVFSTTAADHEQCSVGVYTHTLDGASKAYETELSTVLGVMSEMGYATAEDVAQIPVMPRASSHVVYGPLDDLEGDVDVVMLFVDARQSLIVAEAAQQVERGVAPAMGRPACAVVPQVVRSGKAAVSLGCCGARAYLDSMTDDVALWALPGKQLESYVCRIEVLASANRTLTRFHEIRRKAVASGERPTYAQSMEQLKRAR